MRQVFWPLLILALVGGYMLLPETGAPSPNIAHHSDGESWYRIEQNGQHIGYMRNTVHGFALTTEINYHLPDAPAVVINQQLHLHPQHLGNCGARHTASASVNNTARYP